MDKYRVDDQEELSFLRLSLMPNIGLRTAWSLIGEAGSALEVFSDLPKTASRLTSEQAQNLSDNEIKVRALKIIEFNKKNNISLLTPANDNYPRTFLNLADPPLALYMKGKLPFYSNPSIGVVGTRRATLEAIKNTRNFVNSFIKNNICIVSGLARGIDSEAHQSAVDLSAKTIAVIGSGVFNIYPPENKGLAEKILENNGAIISEYLPYEAPKPYHFPMRNRLIQALSDALLVVEAPKKSGALITAEMAMESGKDVFAIPSSLNNKQAAGTNRLIQDGAFCALEPEDVIERVCSTNARETLRV